MAVFKCKHCGEALDLSLAQNGVCKCSICNMYQTVSTKAKDSESIELFYGNAAHFRKNGEFDLAISAYQQILSLDDTDAEAYFSVALCRYGIEYVKDPRTGVTLPTVNRTQLKSFTDDDDFALALEYATNEQGEEYTRQGELIDEILKGYWQISNNEEPFDVFICYKETVIGSEQRTEDSAIAQHLYRELSRDGVKVFFARETLKGKLGSEYEPYIFAALNSARFMIVIGTKREHFNSVWVKNEWSRYLTLIAQGKKKTVIPVYRDMSAYELPREFKNLQSQNYAEVGATDNIILAIENVLKQEKPTETVIKEAVPKEDLSPKINTSALIERAYDSLMFGDFDEARELASRVIEADYKNADAYIISLLAELKIETLDDLEKHPEPIDKLVNFRKALGYSCGEQKSRLKQISDKINESILKYAEQKRLEEERRLAEQKRLEEEKRLAEQRRLEEERRLAEQKRLEEEKRLAEQKRLEEEKRLAEQRRLEEEKRIAEQKRLEEEKRIAEQRRLEEEKRIAEQRRLEEERRLSEQNAKAPTGKPFKIEGDYIYFGSYPQTVKAPEVIITGTKNEKGYYLGSDGEYYAKVTSKPYESNYKFSTGNIVETGYSYYFKVEPLKWRILSNKGSQALILCESIIDAHRFDAKLNNYEKSEIRKWLNNEFYKTAFTDLQKEIIRTTEVDNSASSTGYSTNQYACGNTSDKIFLLSVADVTNTAYGFRGSDGADSKKNKKPSDYALSNGAYKHTDGNGWWFLRSPYNYYNYGARNVYSGGFIGTDGVERTNRGVVPALEISLNGVVEREEKKQTSTVASAPKTDSKPYTLDESMKYIYFGSYPQTVKAPEVIITGTKNEKGYYLGSDGEYYAELIANPFEDCSRALRSDAFSNGEKIKKGKKYYFKVEPLKWRILSIIGFDAIVLCESIIDAHSFDAKSNNYEKSEIRKWLNNEFYEVAFTDVQKESIRTTVVDNSTQSTGNPLNQYSCANTLDKIFLLSVKEATNLNYGFSSDSDIGDERKVKMLNDYALANLGFKHNSGCGNWLLRSPGDKLSTDICYVHLSGKINNGSIIVNGFGVVPALNIKLFDI